VFQELLERLGRELAAERIPYMVIGGQAVLLYGEPRLTRDIDITLGVGIEGLERVQSLADRLGLKAETDKALEFVRRTMVLPTLEPSSGIQVDFIFSFTPYERQAIERARDVRFGDTVVKFAALEDVITMKVVAGRPRDLDDVRAMLLKNPNYDSRYVSNWLTEFDRATGGDNTGAFKRIKREQAAGG
jgi:hypothetical protein